MAEHILIDAPLQRLCMPRISPKDRFGSEADFARERRLKGDSQKN
jgi:hypothetical protein